MGFPRQEYRSGLPFPSPGDLPNPGTEPVSPALAGRFFTTEPPGKPLYSLYLLFSLEVYTDLSVHMKSFPFLGYQYFLLTCLIVDTWLVLITSFTKLKPALDMLLHFLKGSAITHKRDKILTFPLFFLFN